jgi:hypothetical protein
MSVGTLVLDLVRDPRRIVEAHDGDDLARQAPPLLALTAVAAATIGLSFGQHHSALQAVYSALKLPIVFLVPPLFGVPALAAIADALGLATRPRRAALAGTVVVARVALFALAFAPVTWTFATLFDRYEFTAVTAAGNLALAGLVGVRGFLLVAPRSSEAAWTTRLGLFVAALAIWGSLSAQSGWLLRPFILKPGLEPSLFEPPRSDVFTELIDRLNGRTRVY